ncbi:sensor histidine kinase [Thiomonas bhubaneswarensis]|uniref:Histidine kinase n=1 Tax=Thiomonas bhubaneswarensis TaxID=339866 RepID=A0A0K6HYE7_9BURK|nr:histidine kinase [Thiomonas bhubaneswarensis]CUA95851.1 Histidine kinase [Thiomonas bhubaneswarensis]
MTQKPQSGEQVTANEAAVRLDICGAGSLVRALVALNLLLAMIVLMHWPEGEGRIGTLLLLSWVEPAALLWLALMCVTQRLWRLRAAAAVLTVAMILGGLSALGLNLLVQPLFDALAPNSALRPLQAMLAGAALALVFVHYLQLRARAFTPIDMQARLNELQSRIRPHFLFNTLNAASALVREQPERAEAVLDDLAELFRASVGKPGTLVTLEQEMDLARRYLDIESVRFGERMRVQWHVDETLLQIRIPTLTLQPLVENAVRHGVERSSRTVQIDIDVARRLGQIEVSVRNDLPAMSDAPPPRRHGTGTALRNIRQRLHLLYDIAAEVDQGEVVEDGLARWRARLRLPL